MNIEAQKAHQIEYTEGNQIARQIDNRIWAIYAIYFGLLAAVLNVVFQHHDLHGPARWFISGILISASIAKMALVGHLQWYSDIVYARLREIEDKFDDIKLHKLFLEPAPPKRLWGFHRWLRKLRARNVMQIWAIGVIIVAFGYSLMDLNGGSVMIESQASIALVQAIVRYAFYAVCVFCGALVLMKAIDACAKVKVAKLKIHTEEMLKQKKDSDVHS